jgi:hypothetical protein
MFPCRSVGARGRVVFPDTLTDGVTEGAKTPFTPFLAPSVTFGTASYLELRSPHMV